MGKDEKSLKNLKIKDTMQEGGVECSSYASTLQTRRTIREYRLIKHCYQYSAETSHTYSPVTAESTEAYILYSSTNRGDVQWMRGRRQQDKLDSKSDYNRVYILLAEYYLLSYH